MNTLVHTAAMINLGSSPLVQLIVTILVVGFLVWVCLWALDTFGGIIAEPFRSIVRKVIIFAAIVYVCVVALEVIFGIHLLNL